MQHARTAALLSLLFACAAPQSTVRNEPASLPAPSTPLRPPAPLACATGAECLAAAQRVAAGNDKNSACVLYQRACELGSGSGCNGQASCVEGEPRYALYARACELGDDALGLMEARTSCFNVAEHVRAAEPARAVKLYGMACDTGQQMACGRGARFAVQAGDRAAAARMAEQSCNERGESGCGILGVLYVRGEGVPRDLDRAAAALQRGCKAGDEEACRNNEKLKALISEKASEKSGAGDGDGDGVPGANLTMGSLSADGFTMKDVSCRVQGGGFGVLLMGPVLAGTLGKKQAQLRACHAAGGEPRVRFTMAGGHLSEIKVSAEPAAARACLERALKTVAAPFAGACAATLVLSKK